MSMAETTTAATAIEMKVSVRCRKGLKPSMDRGGHKACPPERGPAETGASPTAYRENRRARSGHGGSRHRNGRLTGPVGADTRTPCQNSIRVSKPMSRHIMDS